MGVIKYHRAKLPRPTQKRIKQQGNLIPDESGRFFIRKYQSSTTIPPNHMVGRGSYAPISVTRKPSLYPNSRWKLSKSEKAWSWVPILGSFQIVKKAFRCNHECDTKASYLLKNQACSLTMLAGAAVLGPPAVITLCGVTVFNAAVASSKKISKMKLKYYKKKLAGCEKYFTKGDRSFKTL